MHCHVTEHVGRRWFHSFGSNCTEGIFGNCHTFVVLGPIDSSTASVESQATPLSASRGSSRFDISNGSGNATLRRTLLTRGNAQKPAVCVSPPPAPPGIVVSCIFIPSHRVLPRRPIVVHPAGLPQTTHTIVIADGRTQSQQCKLAPLKPPFKSLHDLMQCTSEIS